MQQRFLPYHHTQLFGQQITKVRCPRHEQHDNTVLLEMTTPSTVGARQMPDNRTLMSRPFQLSFIFYPPTAGHQSGSPA